MKEFLGVGTAPAAAGSTGKWIWILLDGVCSGLVIWLTSFSHVNPESDVEMDRI
jgi:hypothetical protein